MQFFIFIANVASIYFVLTSKCKIKALRINVHYKTPAREANDVRITSHVTYHEKLRSKVM